MRRKIFLSLLLLFTACLALPGAGWAGVDVTALATALGAVPELEVTFYINDGDNGEDHFVVSDATDATHIVVSGDVTTATPLRLDIPDGVYVGWVADYTYTGVGDAITITTTGTKGDGWFDVSPDDEDDNPMGGKITSSSTGAVIKFNSGTNGAGKLAISGGGSVESTGGNAVDMGQGQWLHVSGTVSADAGTAITNANARVYICGGTVASASGKAISSTEMADVTWGESTTTDKPATIYGTLDCDLRVSSGRQGGAATLNIPAGKTLTLDTDSWLIVLPDGALAVKGTLDNKGNVLRFGTITLDGTLTGNPITIGTAVVNLTAPVLSADSKAATTTGVGYTVTSTDWADAAGNALAAGAKFAASTVYTATVVLTADENYRFPNMPAEDITGTNGTIEDIKDAEKTLTIVVRYPATGAPSSDNGSGGGSPGGSGGGSGGGGTTTPTTPSTPGTITEPKNNVEISNVGEGATIDEPAGTTTDTTGKITLPAAEHGAVRIPTASVTIDVPGATEIAADGTISIPAASAEGAKMTSTVASGATIALPGGSTIKPDGTVTIPAGKSAAMTTASNSTVALPAGSATIKRDGTVAVTGTGAAVTGANGATLALPGGTTIAANGTITLPANTSTTVTTGGVAMDLPGGSTIAPDGAVGTPGSAAVTVRTSDSGMKALIKGILRALAGGADTFALGAASTVTSSSGAWTITFTGTGTVRQGPASSAHRTADGENLFVEVATGTAEYALADGTKTALAAGGEVLLHADGSAEVTNTGTTSGGGTETPPAAGSSGGGGCSAGSFGLLGLALLPLIRRRAR